MTAYGLLTLLLLGASASAPPSSPALLSVGVLPFEVVNLTPAEGRFFSEHLGQQVAVQGAKVTTPQQVQSLLSMEKQRQMLGCNGDDDSCLTELAGALGVDAVLVGSVARFETVTQVNVKILSSRDGRILASASEKAGSTEQVLEILNRSASELAGIAAQKLGRRLAPEGKGLPPSSGLSRYLPGAAGVLVAGFGAFALTRAAGDYEKLTAPGTLSVSVAQGYRDGGARWQAAGWTGLGLGLAGVATSAALLLSAPTVPLAVAPSSSGLFLVGVLP